MSRYLVHIAVCVLLLGCAGDGASRRLDSRIWADQHGLHEANMDATTRPQDDFYQFVNGDWIASIKMDEDRAALGVFTQLADQAQTDMAAILGQAINDHTRRQNLEAASLRPAIVSSTELERDALRALFMSYINREAVESAGLRPLQPFLEEINAIDTATEALAYMGRIKRLGLRAGPLDLFTRMDPGNGQTYALYLSPEDPGITSPAYYTRQDDEAVRVRAAYKAYIATLLSALGMEDFETRAEKVLALEAELAEAMLNRADARDRVLAYNPTDLSAQAVSGQDLPWQAYVQAAGVEGVETLIVTQPAFNTHLAARLRVLEADPESREAWQDYFRFRLLNDLADYLPQDLDAAHFAFHGGAILGVSEDRHMGQRGLVFVDELLGEFMSRDYVAHYFDPAVRVRVADLFANLKAAFAARIRHLNWMEPATKEEALRKLANMTAQIGHPDEMPQLPRLNIEEDDLIGNVLRIGRWKTAQNLARLGKTEDPNDWGTTPQTVNAYYSVSKNRMVLPAAILRPPFFSLQADDAVNYGAIGAVVGHEIIHGFDDQGHKLDADRILRNWWGEADAREFAARAESLVAEYEGLEILDGIWVNGRQTLGENIADLAGVAIAYDAYRLSMQGKQDRSLLGFTGPQRFFVGWAQVWRRVTRAESLRHRILSNTHAPAKLRVNIVLSHTPGFYEAFGVQPGDAMYVPPEERIRIW